MIRTILTRFVALMGILLVFTNVSAQEFPVAVGSDTTFSVGAVYGGGNGIVAVQGDINSPYSINAQLVAAGGTLLGSRISLGSLGVTPGAIPVFDGTNYFLIWREFNGNLKGQFINTAGGLVGGAITIASSVSLQRPGSCAIALADTAFLVVFTKTDDFLYGQFVGKSGVLIGGQIQISNNLARDVALAYDNTNFLVTWVEIIPDSDRDVYAQFVSKTGSLAGNNFLVDGGPNISDNPTSIAFDGTRYLVIYHEQPTTGGNWTIMGSFITPAGAIEETITICDSSLSPIFATVAYDEENYFVTYTQLTDLSMQGRFFNKSGIPIAPAFEVISPEASKMPVGGVGFGGGLYLVVATKVDMNFTDGDVYARFVSPVTDVEYNEYNIPNKFELFQNYPNPFNPRTTISYQLPVSSNVTLKVYDILGNEVATLVKELKEAGTHNTEFDASKLCSGVYLYRLQTGSFDQNKKMLILK